LLEKGITVARTADDLVRYHGKMFIIDGKELFVLGYNFTHMDIDLSRSFGIATTKTSVVKEAQTLFECDSNRHPYKGDKAELIVSPVNARQRLIEFIGDAKKKLWLYEMKISDRDFLKLLNKMIAAGVDVRIISRASAKNGGLPVRKLASRMHLRAILRDGDSAFIGSQSLRKLELEARREIGLIFKDKSVVRQMEAVFEKDWQQSEPSVAVETIASAFTVPAKKVAKEVAKHVALKPVVEQVLEKVLEANENTSVEPEELAQTVHEAFRDEVQGAVVDALRELVVHSAHEQESEPAAPDKK
jgi:phosphatidylserine/phosphatidylglycerophosphate/cardiolipin synthase-like enzyme